MTIRTYSKWKIKTNNDLDGNQSSGNEPYIRLGKKKQLEYLMLIKV